MLQDLLSQTDLHAPRAVQAQQLEADLLDQPRLWQTCYSYLLINLTTAFTKLDGFFFHTFGGFYCNWDYFGVAISI